MSEIHGHSNAADIFTNPPRIASLPETADRPFWSVMIPTFNPRPEHLRQTIESVLAQANEPKEMEIVVVDDCSIGVDVGSLVEEITGGRVGFQKNDRNLGLAGSWNACIERSRGRWIHILHQDDYVGAGFYRRIAEAAEAHPEAMLIAVRSFVVESDGVIAQVAPRVTILENGGRSVADFYYRNPLWFPGVVVRRDCYEQCGGFRTDLIFTLDVEMWTRAISQFGGVVLPDVLAFYRISGGNETSRLFRSARAFEDWDKMIRIFEERYPDFDAGRARRDMLWESLAQAERSKQAGDRDGMAANLAFWKKNATPKLKLRRMISALIQKASSGLG